MPLRFLREKIDSQAARTCNQQEDLLGASYPVRQAVFSGPLHLLLALLEKKQLDISEVNLVEITSSYWVALKEVGQFSPGSMCDFVDVATRLMALKARFLRPTEELAPELDPEDEDDLSSDGTVRAVEEIHGTG